MSANQTQAKVVSTARVSKVPINCPVCESSSYNVHFPDELGAQVALVDYDFKPETQKIYQIVRCNGCGFIYTNPVPDLRPAYTDTVDQVYLSTAEQRRRTAAHDVTRLLAKKKSGRVLDVGCSIGLFLDAAADAGYETEGIELSQWARAEASRRHTVYDKPLAELKWKERFDIITLWGVIEHLSYPAREMQLVFEALKPGGYVFIYTGDVGSSVARIMGRRWYWFMGMHLMYFSRSTLSLLLKKLGFAEITYETHKMYFSLGSLAISMRRYKVLSPLVWVLKQRALASRFVALTVPGEMLMVAKKSAG
jgi:SAM-dependent methyltransferase